MLNRTVHYFAIGLMALVLVTIWFRHGHILGTGESGLPFYNLARQYDFSRFAWAPPALGNSIPLTLGAIPLYWLLAQIEALGIPNFVIQAGFIFVILSVAGIATFDLTATFFPALAKKYLLLAVLFYWFNPFSLVNVWNRFLYSHMLFWAFLPLFLMCIVRGFFARRYIYAILAAFLTFVFSYCLAAPAFTLLTAFVFSITFFYYFLVMPDRWFGIKYAGIFLVVSVLFNAWWLGQFVVMATSSGGYLAGAILPSGNVSTLTGLSKQLGMLSYTIRLVHKNFFEINLPWIKVVSNPLSTVIGFVASGLILVTFYRFRKNKTVILCELLFLAGLFLVKGNAPPFGELFHFIFVKVPLAQIFRNPFEKFGFLLPLAGAPIFALGMESWARVLGRTGKTILLGVTVGVVGLLWGFPFWSQSAVAYEVGVPKYYQDVDSYLQQFSGDMRFVSLPLGGEGIDYTWDKPYSGVELSSTLFATPNVSFNTSLPFYADIVGGLAANQLTDDLVDFMPFIAGKYIVVRQDLDFAKRSIANPGVVAQKLTSLEERGLVSKKFGSGKLAVYEIASDLQWPKIFLADRIISTNTKDLNKVAHLETGFPRTKLAVVDTTISGMPTDKTILAPSNTFLQKVVTPLPKDLSDDDLLAKLFYAEHLPGQMLYPYIRIREKLLTLNEKDPEGRVILKTGFLGKRAAEVYKLKKKNASDTRVQEAENNYLAEFEEAVPLMEGYINLTTPTAELIKNSLLYQYVLLERVNSSLVDKLGNFLVLWGAKPRFELPVSANDYVVYTFAVPIHQTYQMNMAPLVSVGARVVYIDGKSRDVNLADEVLNLNLEAGTHEIAAVVDSTKTDRKLITSDNGTFSSTAGFSRKIDTPDVSTQYHVSFNFRFVEGDALILRFLSDIETPSSPTLFVRVEKDKKYHGWKHWDGKFTTKVGTTSGLFETLPVQDMECTTKWWGWKSCALAPQKYISEISNLQISAVNLPEIVLAAGESTSSASDQKISWKKINPTLYTGTIVKNDAKPAVLVFSELFNSGWSLDLEGGAAGLAKHVPVNVFANGWLIDKPGNYKFNISFWPQRIFDVGKVISAISLSLAVALIISVKLTGRWKK